MEVKNPIIKYDFPDPEVIRVGDTYYMVSSTRHFFPGGVILRSYDLINWEIATYLFDKLDSTPQQTMVGEMSIYSKGMWSASIKYHNKKFYVLFSAYDTQKSYLFTADDIMGPWSRKDVQGVYHHCSLLFDEDRVFVAYGMNEIHLTELDKDINGPLAGGLDRVITKYTEKAYVGYEGADLYKINGTYYLFLIQWPITPGGRRTQWCFMSDSLEGKFEGQIVFDDDMGFYNQGVAKGGLVDTPDGKWFSVMYQDRGALGKMPVLVPVTWNGKIPVFGDNGKMPKKFEVTSNRPNYDYEPLYTSEIFTGRVDKSGRPEIALPWQWNHEPNDALWRKTEDGGLAIKSGKISVNLVQAANTLTQRMYYPGSSMEVSLDVTDLEDGDCAGLCALQGCYGWIGVKKEIGRYFLVMQCRSLQDNNMSQLGPDFMPGTETYKVQIRENLVRLKIKVDFTDVKDTAEFFYRDNGKWEKIGSQRLIFKLDHFMGSRYGMFIYSTRKTGGEAVFYNVAYDIDN